MKFLILCLILTCSFAALAGTEITLDPGARATINAGDSVTVQCSGSSNVDDRGECFLIRAGNRDPKGFNCNYVSSVTCTTYYAFGIFIESRIFDNDLPGAAKWCREKLAGK